MELWFEPECANQALVGWTKDFDMRILKILPLVLLGTTAAWAQPTIQFGPGGVQIDPGGRREPREERIVREEGGCRITIIRRTDENGRRTSRRVRECDEEFDDE